MGIFTGRSVALMLAAAALLGGTLPAIAQNATESDARTLRWENLKQAIFGTRVVNDGTGTIELEAPDRALDAALVPITIKLTGKETIRGLYLVVDMNPAPVASHFVFGPQSDPRVLKLRVRVDQYTAVHAIAETTAGKLYVAERFVKAAGGCSAPAGESDAQALQNLGQMKLRILGPFAPGKPTLAQLMIRHPNFNGMQMDQLTHLYTPARYIQTVDVTYRGGKVFHLDSDISLSADPVITFGFLPQTVGELQVSARDSTGATFDRRFAIPQSTADVSTAK